MNEASRSDRRNWRAALRGPNRAETFGVAIGAALVGAACWYFGVDGWHALTYAGAAVAVGALYLALPDYRAVRWRDADSTRPGARHDLSWLSSSLRQRYGRVGDRAVQTLRELVRERLTRHHLDPANPEHRGAIEALIGTGGYAMLQPKQTWRPTYRTVVNCLNRLDELDRRTPTEERSA